MLSMSGSLVKYKISMFTYLTHCLKTRLIKPYALKERLISIDHSGSHSGFSRGETTVTLNEEHKYLIY